VEAAGARSPGGARNEVDATAAISAAVEAVAERAAEKPGAPESERAPQAAAVTEARTPEAAAPSNAGVPANDAVPPHDVAPANDAVVSNAAAPSEAEAPPEDAAMAEAASRSNAAAPSEATSSDAASAPAPVPHRGAPASREERSGRSAGRRLQPWFGDEGKGLGIAGTARKPGAPGTHVVPGVRVVRVDRHGARPAAEPSAAERPVRQEGAASTPSDRPARHVGSAQADRPVRHVGTASSTPAERPVRHVGAATADRPVRHVGTASSTPAGRPVRHVGAASADRPVRHVGTASSTPAERPVRHVGAASADRPVRHVGTASSTPAERPVRQVGAAGGASAAPAARAAEAAPASSEARPVVHVSLSQAAAAGHQTLRPLSPAAPTAVATVTRATAAPAKEKPRREAAPVEPLPVPTAEALFLAVQGLGTPACRARVERAIRAVPGVTEVDANLAAGIVAVVPATVDRAAVEAALVAAGHPARPGTPDAGALRQQARARAIAAGATAAVGIAAQIALVAIGDRLVASLVAAAALATAWQVTGPALRHLVRLRPATELLPVAATLAILAAAQIAPDGSPALAALPLAIHLAVAALGDLAGARALGVIGRLRAALPSGDAPAPGTKVEVPAGGVLPADGRLLADAVLDERAIGGDEDVERLAGESVAAGAIARDGALLVVEDGRERRRVARGLRVAERALATRPGGTPAQALSVLLVPAALAAAVAAWLTAGPWAAAALLAGASPLGLGLSAALATAAGVTRAALRGVAVRSAATLERAARTRVVLLDKTSTLTRGDAAVLELLPKPGRDPREVLAAAAAAEAGVDHGIARALARHARDLGVEIPAATDHRHAPGLGVSARVGGVEVHVGSAQYAARCGVDLGLLVQTVGELAGRGRTPVVVAFGAEAVAVLGIAETPRESARQAVASMELLDLQLHVGSGDATAAVQWLTEAIGLDKRIARGDLSPAAKKELVDELRSTGPCLVAGASAVDAEAMAGADLAIAAGTDPKVESVAGALLVRHDPQGVVELIRAGRATRRGRRAATLFGLAANAGAMGLAAAGSVGVGGAAALGLVGSVLALGAAASPWVRVR